LREHPKPRRNVQDLNRHEESSTGDRGMMNESGRGFMIEPAAEKESGKLGGRGRSRETGTRSGWLAPAVGPPEPALPGKPASLDRGVPTCHASRKTVWQILNATENYKFPVGGASLRLAA